MCVLRTAYVDHSSATTKQKHINPEEEEALNKVLMSMMLWLNVWKE